MEKEKTYYTEDLIEEAIDELQDRIQWCKEEEEEPTFKKPAVKLTANKGDNNA